jgi:hypothetical protein
VKDLSLSSQCGGGSPTYTSDNYANRALEKIITMDTDFVLAIALSKSDFLKLVELEEMM